MYQLKLKFLSLCLFLGLSSVCSGLHATTYYVSNNGSDTNAGTRTFPFKTISKGAEKAQARDTIFVLAGVYRERVSPPRGGRDGAPIVYMGEPGKRVYIKGSDVYAGKWEKSPTDGVFIADLDQMQFTDDCYVDNANPFKVKLILIEQNAGTCGQVFVKGLPYQQKSTKSAMDAAAGSWWYDEATNKVSIHFHTQHSPGNTVELTTRRRVFAPHGAQMGLGYINVEGFIIEHCGNQFPKWTKETMQAGALGLQSGHHWVVRNNVVRYAANAGIDCGFLSDTNERQLKPGWGWPAPGVTGNIIENNYLIDNGCVGITGTGTYQMICRRNVVMWNHNQGFQTNNAEQAGIKFHGCNRGLISENYIAENFHFGIWLDNKFPNARVTRNIFVGNSNRGIAVEMSEYAFGAGALIDHNVIMDNHSEMQIDLMDASGSLFVNNLIAGDMQGVIVRQVYGRDATRSDKNAFYNNIFSNNSSNIYSIPYPTARAGEHRFLGNLYDGSGRKMFINNWCDTNSTSPYNESQFRSQVATDAGTTTTALNSAGAFADKVVKLNLAEWKTFWSKHTTQNDNDAEVITGLTAEYLPATQSVKLTLPTAVAQRDNTRWDTPYRDIYGLTEDSSYPGPFDNLQAGTHEYSFYSGTLPILERGKLPGPEETEEPDVPYADYNFQQTQYSVTIKVIDATGGILTNPDGDYFNVYAWLDEGLTNLNPRNPANWWYPLYNGTADPGEPVYLPIGSVYPEQGKLVWSLNLNVNPGTYQWSASAKSLNWQNLAPYMTVPLEGNPEFTVSSNGTVTGITSVTVDQLYSNTLVVKTDNYSILVAGNNLTVTGQFDSVQLYTLTGILIDAVKMSEHYSKTLPSGLYIIAVDGKAQKIRVK